MSHPDPGLRFHGDIVAAPGQLDFAVNVIPGGPPEWLLEALGDGLSRAAAYPDEGPATAAVAARHRRPPEEVVLLNGAAEAFWLLAQVLRPQLAVVVAPSFTEPEAALQAAGRRVQQVWRDPDSFHLVPAAVPAEAGLVLTGNPNNPTGTLDPAATLARLARPGRVLVVDEAFMELTPGEAESLAGRRDLPGVVVVRSLTKLWGLAATREQLAAALAALPSVRIWPSAANFLLLEVADGPAILHRLAARGIAVRPCHSFPGLTANHLRIAVRDPADNQRLVNALAETPDAGVPGYW